MKAMEGKQSKSELWQRVSDATKAIGLAEERHGSWSKEHLDAVSERARVIDQYKGCK